MSSITQTKPKKPFSTVLIARETSEYPSELEIALRPWSTLIRIIPKLAGDAHILIPGKESIAVRAYYPNDIKNMEEYYAENIRQQQQENNIHSCSRETITSQYVMKLITNRNEEGEGSNIISSNSAVEKLELDKSCDGIQLFRDSFKHSVIFLIIPSIEMQQDQLSRIDSFFMRSQRCLTQYNTTSTKDSSSPSLSNKRQSTSKIFLVPNTTLVLSTLTTIIETIQPEKNELKRKFFEKEAIKTGLPKNSATVTSIGNNQQLRPLNEASFATHTATSFREWATRFEVPTGDTNVLLSVFGNLSKISLADIDSLDKIPLHDSTKLILTRFFASSRSSSGGVICEDDGYQAFSLNENYSTNKNNIMQEPY